MNNIVDYWRGSSVSDKLFAAGLLLYFLFVSIDWDIAKQGLYFATLVALIYLAAGRREPFRLAKWEWLLIAVIVVFMAHAALSWWINDMPEHGYVHLRGRLAKILFLVPIYLYVRTRGFSFRVLTGLLALAALAAGGYGIVEFVKDDFRFLRRIGGSGNSTLHYALIVSVMVSFLWVAALRFWRYSSGWLLAVVLGSSAALAGAIISGTRGAWLALLAAAAALVTVLLKDATWKGRMGVVVAVAAVLTGFSQTDIVAQRVSQACANTTSYFTEGKVENSVGVRLELWHIAWKLGRENPVFGVGPAGFDDTVRRGAENDKWDELYSRFEYPHSGYMAAFSSRGLIGLVLSLTVLLLPGWYFWKRWRGEQSEARYAALAGWVVILVFAVGCLTYEHLEGRVQMSLYATLVGLLLGMVRHEERKAEE